MELVITNGGTKMKKPHFVGQSGAFYSTGIQR